MGIFGSLGRVINAAATETFKPPDERLSQEELARTYFTREDQALLGRNQFDDYTTLLYTKSVKAFGEPPVDTRAEYEEPVEEAEQPTPNYIPPDQLSPDHYDIQDEDGHKSYALPIAVGIAVVVMLVGMQTVL